MQIHKPINARTYIHRFAYSYRRSLTHAYIYRSVSFTHTHLCVCVWILSFFSSRQLPLFLFHIFFFPSCRLCPTSPFTLFMFFPRSLILSLSLLFYFPFNFTLSFSLPFDFFFFLLRPPLLLALTRLYLSLLSLLFSSLFHLLPNIFLPLPLFT